jgi:hypothetical protein
LPHSYIAASTDRRTHRGRTVAPRVRGDNRDGAGTLFTKFEPSIRPVRRSKKICAPSGTTFATA